MEFQVDGQRCFGIRYKDIAISNANGKNEVALEFNQDAEDSNKGGQGDILCEMRFHVPNNELDIYREQREAKKKEEKKKKKEAAKNGGANEENKQASDEESDEFDYTQEGDEMTAAKLFNAKIHDKANMDEFSGEIVCSIQDLPMLIPRGNYSLDFYSNFARLHGKTRDYKINFKDISQIIMLEKPDGIHMVYVLHLNTPLRQGLTLHHFVAFNFEVDRE
jgi:structure-specific recognition protein 1